MKFTSGNFQNESMTFDKIHDWRKHSNQILDTSLRELLKTIFGMRAEFRVLLLKEMLRSSVLGSLKKMYECVFRISINQVFKLFQSGIFKIVDGPVVHSYENHCLFYILLVLAMAQIFPDIFSVLNNSY